MLRILALLLVLVPCQALAVPWQIDRDTSVEVDVGWSGGTAAVRFPTLSGGIDFDPEHPERVKGLISVSSRDATVGIAPVDNLLRGEGYLNARVYPDITFRLDRLVQTSRSTAEIFGMITLRGITRPVNFAASVLRYGPAADDPDRFEAGFDLTGEIDRSDFGSTAGIPEISRVLPVRIRLLISSQ